MTNNAIRGNIGIKEVITVKLKRPMTRRSLAKKLKTTENSLRYHEESGRFKPIKKTDEIGRPLVIYSDEEIRKAFEYYSTRNFNYKTEAGQLR